MTKDEAVKISVGVLKSIYNEDIQNVMGIIYAESRYLENGDTSHLAGYMTSLRDDINDIISTLQC